MAKNKITTSSAQTRRLREIARKKIPGTVVWGRFISCLKLAPNIDITTKLSVILGGGLQKWDLGLKLMGFPAFMEDGVILQKANVQNCETIEDLSELVFKWYRKNGWEVE